MGGVWVPASQNCLRVKQLLVCKALGLCLAHSKHCIKCSCNSSLTTIPQLPLPQACLPTGVSPPSAALPTSLTLPSRCHSSYMSLLPSAKTWGHSYGCPFREKTPQADFMNSSHFPLSRLMAQLPTVSPSVVAANDFSPPHVSSAFASEISFWMARLL